MNNNNNACYKPSGKISLKFFAICPLLVLFSIPILSYIYIHVIYYMPIVYINFLFSMGCGAILGLIIGKAVKIGNARNVLVTAIISLLSVIVMKYVMWTFYIPLVYSKAYGELQYSFLEGLFISISLLVNPSEVFEYIKEINSVGVWSIRRFDVNGTLLYIIWFCEFCILAFSCITIACGKAKEPFCEDNKKWFVQRKNKIRLNMPENISRFKEKLVASQYDDFITLLNAPFINSQDYLNVIFYYLDDVHYGYVTVKTIIPTVDKKGNIKEKEDTLIEFLKIESEIFAILLNYN